ncbi:hypothetical protein AX17_002055 [Amanita inopinata Kibby_2008]|nr:hypothetical protein AX17_002055 [Amanita inopinata Kibby_2008]
MDDTLRNVRIISYVDVATIALLVYDYLLTLPLEVAWIWQSRWTIVNALYLLMRYMPFVNVALILLVDLPGRRPQGCATLNTAYAYLVVADFALSEIILTLRIWAIWARSKYLGVGLIVFYLGVWTFAAVNMEEFLKTVRFEAVQLSVGSACVVTAASKRLIVNWIMLMVHDGVTGTLMAIQAYYTFKYGGRSQLLWMIYRDGLVYYMYLLGIAVISVILILHLPPALLRVTVSPSHVIHTSLTARVVLHAREQANKQEIHESTSFFDHTY